MKPAIAQYNENEYPQYSGNDLGLVYSPSASVFRIWAPSATAAEILLYRSDNESDAATAVAMTKDADGTWLTRLAGDRKGTYYTFRVKVNNRWSLEVTDPYAKACGTNGKRAMVVDLQATNPDGWLNDHSPDFSKENKPTDAIIYELHVRDASIHFSSGIKQKGKFAGLAETNTRQKELSTGLDHLKDLGVTHIHLLPVFDFYSVNESPGSKPQYNWGYDPQNYNIPEGSYSSNPADGTVRIREFKQLVQTFHRHGLRVVMDVVYNHTALAAKSNFNQLVPGYYYRHTADGKFSDATACGNEIASERPMMRKFILESLVYWVKEYHIDGFRFDLMGVHDIETMNIISSALRQIKPDILLYGEGWAAGDSPLPASRRALKEQVSQLNDIAVFSDDIRNAVKGSVFNSRDSGFVSGKAGVEDDIRSGIVASCKHPQLTNGKAYATSPAQIVTYCECHDNHTLRDKLALSNPGTSEEDRLKMHQLALSIILTSQGIPFLHAGTEFYRTKKGVENSYKSPDSINAIDWRLKETYHDLFQTVKTLINIRKAHPAFRMQQNSQIAGSINFVARSTPGLVAYTINGVSSGDSWTNIFVAYNANPEPVNMVLPAGNWKPGFITENMILDGNKLIVPAIGACIFYTED